MYPLLLLLLLRGMQYSPVAQGLAGAMNWHIVSIDMLTLLEGTSYTQLNTPSALWCALRAQKIASPLMCYRAPASCIFTNGDVSAIKGSEVTDEEWVCRTSVGRYGGQQGSCGTRSVVGKLSNNSEYLIDKVVFHISE